MQIVSNKDTLHVMPNPVLYGKYETIINVSFAELA